MLEIHHPDRSGIHIRRGWRMEEIAASLPTSGLDITPEESWLWLLLPSMLPDFNPWPVRR